MTNTRLAVAVAIILAFGIGTVFAGLGLRYGLLVDIHRSYCNPQELVDGGKSPDQILPGGHYVQFTVIPEQEGVTAIITSDRIPAQVFTTDNKSQFETVLYSTVKYRIQLETDGGRNTSMLIYPAEDAYTIHME